MGSTSFPDFSCDVVVPIWNQPERTRRCLESVLAHSPAGTRFLLIDNGSEPETQALLERFRKESPLPVQVIRNPENRGFIKAVNQGIRSSTSRWICILNNDTIVTAGWLEEMARVAEADPKIGLVNPTSNSLGFHAGNEPLDSFAESLRNQAGRWSELTTALGFCLLAARRLFDEVGLLDESFGMGYFDDDDLSRRIRASGKICVRACAAYVYHEERGSFRHLPGTDEAFKKNREIFEKRWGRRLRILWAISRPDGIRSDELTRTALELCGQGHWLYLASRPGAVPETVRRHAQVSVTPIAGGFWRLKLFWRLVTKRKKPFDLVVSDDAPWSAWVKRCRRLHRAHLLESPPPGLISEECRRLAGRIVS